MAALREGGRLRKLKVNHDQIMEIIAAHLESLGAINPDEHVNITPLQVKEGMITLYISKGKVE